MANTLEDLYFKYQNKVSRSLETDKYFQYMFEMVLAGSNTLKQTNRILHKKVDEKWLTLVEESIDALNQIVTNPRKFIATDEEVVPVELAKRITSDSVRHLSQNTQFIGGISKKGQIQPTRILNVTTRESYDLYENRFIYTLIKKLVNFIDKRTDVIFWATGDEKESLVAMESHIDDAYEQIEYKMEMTIKNKQSFAETDSQHMEVFKRIDRVRRLVMELRRTPFCQIMEGTAVVRSPIQRTNLLIKNPQYRKCYQLWQFLESYTDVGYSIEVRDTALEFDEEYLYQLYTNLLMNYTVFKSILETDQRRIEEARPNRKKTVKPKFVKQVVEQIVDDYDIPDVEIKRVIVEEITKAQLEIERKQKEKEKARLAKEKEKAKQKAAREKEKEKERLAREKEREKEKARLAKEREKERARLAREREKEREKARIAKEKEKEKARIAREKEREREKIAREKEREKEKARLAREKEREKARIAREKEKEKERLAKQREREKEKARLAKQREREKEKARIAREKEREKAKIAREKEKEKERLARAKEREKEKARLAKEREKTKKQAKTAAKPPADTSPAKPDVNNVETVSDGTAEE